VKWLAVVALAVLTLFAVACVHSDNRLTAAIAMGLFGGAVALTFVLIAAQAHPFGGEFGIKPDVLLQVQSAKS
jgi:multisubunit Na+/H+ antiporter MnhC subunit